LTKILCLRFTVFDTLTSQNRQIKSVKARTLKFGQKKLEQKLDMATPSPLPYNLLGRSYKAL
jgi:hypothetical protein